MGIQGSQGLGDSMFISSDLKLHVFLQFRPELERRYCELQNRHAARSFRYRAVTIFFLYVILSTGIAGLLPSDQLNAWLSIYGWVGVIVVAAGALAYVHQFDRWFNWYVGCGSALAVSLSLLAAACIQGDHSETLLHVAIMYAVVIVYGFTGLRFYTVSLAGWVGGLLGITASQYVDGVVDWELLLRTYSGPSLLGMCLAYASDYRSRVNFLQACALEQAQQETERKNQLLQELNRVDGLTGLYNRRHLDDVLCEEWNRAMRQQQPLAVLMIDIDYFKLYNDTLGHPAGDICLRQVADQLGRLARRSGDLAARYGGEEFVLLYPATNPSQAVRLARELLTNMDAVALPHPSSPVSRCVTLSIGIAVITPPYNAPLELLLDQADRALYEAKMNGRNRSVLFGMGDVPQPV